MGDDETIKIEKIKENIPNVAPDANVPTSHGYFYGHACHLSADKLSAYELNCKGTRKWLFNIITVHAGDVRAINMHRSYAALCAEKYRHYQHFRYTIHPYSKLRFYLEFLFVFLMILSSILVALHYAEKRGDYSDYHEVLLLFSDSMIIVNIIVNFFTGYIEGYSRKMSVLSKKKIARKYITTWLILDVVACFGIPANYYSSQKTFYLVLEAMRLVRLPIIMIYLQNVLTVMNASNYQKTGVEILFSLIMFLTWNIYFQFSVDYIIEGTHLPQNPRNCSWLTVGNLWNQTTKVRILYAFDRAVGMLTTNTNMNLLEQKGCFENFIVTCWIFSKIVIYHYTLKYILALFGKESARAHYYMMKKQLQTYMAHRNFPPRLKSKILKFYAIRFQSKYFEESRMLGCVSGQLREDILMHTGRQLVRELEFLKQLPSSLLVQIAFKLRVVIYIAGDIIFKINTVGDCIYFIDRGTVAIYSDSGKEICHLEDGDFFGEIALVMKHHFRTASAIAVTNCELFRLDREHFETTIAYYPTVYNSIKEVATSRFERTCVLDEHHKAEPRTAKQD
ncbi:potassium/sodium hyperpolarization-activated cyclic nucleotide-gated channel 2-like [Spodoptera litura]|uniref:Potassium/sodium hyperpolarization-activated cyclic nucleotide-gated channel 2-like n=1 Tax=Spodoptera litura TaxID=69820 RepID=A0A9J7EV66_SPOLT|nr:potassium/sodium hyperpolarization-activated cyclic nucleotide-gated channel 2-like [Spodoptera litura]